MVHTGSHGEHPHGDLGQLILVVVFLVVWVFDSFIFHFSTMLTSYFPLYLRLPLAGLVLICALFLVRSGHKAISEEVQKNPQVLDDGAFSRVRHPLYLAALLFYIFLLCISPSIICLGLWIVIFLFYNFIASYEEKLLIEKFGSDYQEYIDRVPKWIPKIKD
jgi:protein-S-isoprenylcysteine O-methyltransferase Ste14